jgi:pimeloyl-ACP methyl ester carboxylesterase
MSARPVIAALLSLASTACTLVPRPAPAPVKTLVDEPESRAKELVVLLPGRHSLPGEFVREGFVARVRAARPAAKIVVPDLHLGYYRKQTMHERLHRDVIAPARASGIDRVTLVGISMGGLGAMIYDLEHPGNVEEIILLSPFLGDPSVIEDIQAQGGLAKWWPQGEDPDAFSRRLWLRLRESWLTRRDRPALRLGCGEDDRLAATTRLAAAELRPATTLWQPGGHDWPTWNRLIEKMD